jgi:hypothetical protein
MSCSKKLRHEIAPTKRQEAKDRRNHGCKVTTQYSINQLRSFYPFSIAKSIAIVSFESDTAFTNTLPIIHGEIDYAQIRETKVLNQPQIDSLAGLFYNVIYRGEIIYLWEAGCYNPRNAVLFFDSEHHLLEFIELCFECYRHRVSSDKVSIGDLCSQKSSMIKDFFLNAGIKVGTTTRQVN